MIRYRRQDCDVGSTLILNCQLFVGFDSYRKRTIRLLNGHQQIIFFSMS